MLGVPLGFKFFLGILKIGVGGHDLMIDTEVWHEVVVGEVDLGGLGNWLVPRGGAWDWSELLGVVVVMSVGRSIVCEQSDKN